jgi:Reverse transcriptase (RNA-dependent DNA polymerase)
LLYSCRTCVNFNSELGEYFSYQRGVRQGDPLSSFLFNLITDVLHRIIHNAQEHGYLSGIQISTNCFRIINLYFSYDTLLFLEATKSNIEVLQWILISFEQMSGMNINFSKCELIPFNITSEFGMTFASKFCCKLDSLPITYLGFSLHNKKLSTSEWNFLVEKIEHK